VTKIRESPTKLFEKEVALVPRDIAGDMTWRDQQFAEMRISTQRITDVLPEMRRTLLRHELMFLCKKTNKEKLGKNNTKNEKNFRKNSKT
jgi:hypothetical protein